MYENVGKGLTLWCRISLLRVFLSKRKLREHFRIWYVQKNQPSIQQIYFLNFMKPIQASVT